ncbi:hypothetical protein BH11VER1_BH11VER1_13070 [soil metagenome]
MTTIAKATTTLSLLIPSSLMPGEGEEVSLHAVPEGAGDSAALLHVFEKFALPRAAHFTLKGSDVSFDGDIDAESSLQLLTIAAGATEESPMLEARSAMSYFDWAGVVSELSQAVASPHFLGTHEELTRVFTEAVREVSHIAALGFTGEAVPLLTFKSNREDDSVTLSFLGIWLAGQHDMEEMRAKLPAQSWHDGANFGQSTCILLDVADVEGRGLKEALLSAAMLAVVFGSGMTHAAEPVSMAKRTSLFGFDSKNGEKLPVKSQKLVQDAPRFYRDVLEREHQDLRIIVNIGAQRAYLIKDGQIAFETPISSGRGPRMTKRGTFTITEKVRSGKMSTIYKCPLPGWMRIGDLPIGMHQGDLPGYPASHGCIRMPLESALFIFDHAPKGTTVQIVDSWTPQPVEPGLVATN